MYHWIGVMAVATVHMKLVMCISIFRCSFIFTKNAMNIMWVITTAQVASRVNMFFPDFLHNMVELQSL